MVIAGKKDKISVVLPCRDEEEALGECISTIKKVLDGKEYEIIVSSSSSDGSDEIARNNGVKLVRCGKGYGNAYLEGFKHVSGEVVVMGDADSSYDFSQIPLFLEKLRNGTDFVIGNRLGGRIEKGAMKPLHRYIGNPGLTLLFNLIYRTHFSDTHSGFRAIKAEKLDKLKGEGLESGGMEFALEMLIKSAKSGINVGEVKVSYRKRRGKSKLRSFKDGVRHIKMMVRNTIF